MAEHLDWGAVEDGHRCSDMFLGFLNLHAGIVPGAGRSTGRHSHLVGGVLLHSGDPVRLAGH